MTDVDGKWLREIGFTYHAISKYFYRNTINDVLLVRLQEGECQLSVVGGFVDPSDYPDYEASLTGRATRAEIESVLAICEKEQTEPGDTG